MSENVNVRHQLYWNSLVRIPALGVSFIISIIVARLLMPKDYGIMGIAMMLIGYTNLFTDFGFGEAIVQRGVHDKKTLNSIFTVNFTVSIILALLFYLSAGYISEFFKSPECESVIKVLSSVFIITSFSAVPTAVLKRDMNFKTISLMELGRSLLMAVVTLLLALNGYGYWSLAFGQLIPTVLVTVYLCFRTGWFPVVTYSHSSMKNIINFGIWNFLKTQLGFIAQHTDKFIIGRWLGTLSLGFYDKALSIADMPYNAFIMNINGVMFSAFSRIKDDRIQLQQQFKKSLALLSLVNFPIYCGLIVIAPYFVHTLLGEKWSPMILPFQIILIGGMFKSFSGMTTSLNVGIGKYRSHTIRFLGAWMVFVAACFLLVGIDITGIAVGYAIYNLCLIILWMNLSLGSIGLSWKVVFHSIRTGALASLCMLIITSLMVNIIFQEYSYLNMTYVAVSGALLYCIFVLLDKSELTQEFKALAVSDIKKKITAVFEECR